MLSKAGTWKMRNLTGPCPSCGSNMPFEFHGSCRLRASWTPAERAAFDARDDAAFALEASVRLEQYGPEELETRPAAGQIVLLEHIRIRANGNTRRAWRALCADCGREFVIRHDSITRGATRCAECFRLKRSPLSVIARSAGITRRCLYKRKLRGWSPRDWTLPSGQRRAA
jgi:hypothetical protein